MDKPKELESRHETKLILTIKSFQKDLVDHYLEQIRFFIDEIHQEQIDDKTKKEDMVWIDEVGETDESNNR